MWCVRAAAMMRWLLGHTDGHGYVASWNQVRADQAAADTERLLLGHAGPARVVGNKRHEAFWAQIERTPKVRAFQRRRG